MLKQTDTPQEEKPTIYYDQRSVALRTTQNVYFVQEHDKMAMLELVLNDHKERQTVIVVQSKKKADAISKFLLSNEFKVTSIHGNHREEQQEKATAEFNLGTLNIIITTDMIFRTLALENVKFVLSYDLPELPQDYYNRLAVMKELGVGIALVDPEDEVLLSNIEFNMKAEIEEKMVEGFVATDALKQITKRKKDRSKKPRHRKSKIKADK